jgi:O-antigen/teichoic acid export membrane protein
MTALVDQGLVSATNALTTIIIARACSKEELGLYAAGFSLIVLAFSVQKALIVTPYTVLSPRTFDEKLRRYKGSTLTHNIFLSTILSTAILAVGMILLLDGENSTRDLGMLLSILSVSGSFIMLREFVRLVAIADLDFWQALKIDSIAVLLQLSGLGLCWRLGVLDAGTALAISGAAAGIASLVYFSKNRSLYRFRSRDFGEDLKKNWVFGKWLFGSSFLRQISVSVYPWLIIHFHGPAEAGVWASCVAVVALYNPVMLALYNEAAPRIAHSAAFGFVEDIWGAVSRSTKLCSLVAAPFFVVLLFFGGDLVSLVYGPKYEGNDLTVALLATSSFLLAFGFAFPYGLNRPGLDFVGNMASATVLVTFGVWAAQSYGALGSAAGVLLTHAVAVVIKASSFKLVAARTPS